MLEINIDVIQNVDFESFGQAQIEAFEQAIESLAIATRDKWVSLAQEKLQSSRSEYVRGLQESTSFQKNGRLDYQINLVGFLPNAVEGGLNPYDMKPGLLGGKAAAKNQGKYVTIPFRHYPSAQSAERVPTKVPNYKQDLANVMKRSGLGGIKKAPSGQALQGKVGIAKGTQKYVQKLKPHHKNTIFEGLTQYQKTYQKSTQSQFMTFRRVSQKSDPSSWLHPGIKAVRIVPEVESWVQEQLSTIVESIAKGDV